MMHTIITHDYHTTSAKIHPTSFTEHRILTTIPYE